MVRRWTQAAGDTAIARIVGLGGEAEFVARPGDARSRAAPLRSACSRLRLVQRLALSPGGIRQPLATTGRAPNAGQGHRVFTLTYHSPSLAPGHTPYVHTSGDLALFLDRIERLLAFFLRNSGAGDDPLDVRQLALAGQAVGLAPASPTRFPYRCEDRRPKPQTHGAGLTIQCRQHPSCERVIARVAENSDYAAVTLRADCFRIGVCISMSATPGPNNAMVASSGATFGFARTMPHLLGVALGFPLMIVVRGRCWRPDADHSSSARHLKWIGAASSIWLALQEDRHSPARVGQGAPCSGLTPGRATPLTFFQAACSSGSIRRRGS